MQSETASDNDPTLSGSIQNGADNVNSEQPTECANYSHFSVEDLSWILKNLTELEFKLSKEVEEAFLENKFCSEAAKVADLPKTITKYQSSLRNKCRIPLESTERILSEIIEDILTDGREKDLYNWNGGILSGSASGSGGGVAHWGSNWKDANKKGRDTDRKGTSKEKRKEERDPLAGYADEKEEKLVDENGETKDSLHLLRKKVAFGENLKTKETEALIQGLISHRIVVDTQKCVKNRKSSVSAKPKRQMKRFSSPLKGSETASTASSTQIATFSDESGTEDETEEKSTVVESVNFDENLAENGPPTEIKEELGERKEEELQEGIVENTGTATISSEKGPNKEVAVEASKDNSGFKNLPEESLAAGVDGPVVATKSLLSGSQKFFAEIVWKRDDKPEKEEVDEATKEERNKESDNNVTENALTEEKIPKEEISTVVSREEEITEEDSKVRTGENIPNANLYLEDDDLVEGARYHSEGESPTTENFNGKSEVAPIDGEATPDSEEKAMGSERERKLSVSASSESSGKKKETVGSRLKTTEEKEKKEEGTLEASPGTDEGESTTLSPSSQDKKGNHEKAWKKKPPNKKKKQKKK